MDEKVSKFKKMIKEKGLKEAIENMRRTGGFYEGDFIEDKKNNRIFSNEEIDEFAKHLREPEPVEVTIANQEPNIAPIFNIDYEVEGQLKRVDQEVAPIIDNEVFSY